MRVLLIRPHSVSSSSKGHGVHLGLAYLAGALMADGVEVKVADLDILPVDQTESYYLKTLRDFQPEMVGITINTADRFNAFQIARITKRWSSAVPVVAGGPHVTFTAEDTLRNVGEIDIVVIGEGEATLAELCHAIGSGTGLAPISGTAYRKNGEVVVNASRGLIRNLDQVPFPARELFDIEKYDLSMPVPGHPRCIHMISSRGCPFKCSFCVAGKMAGGRIRMRSPENIIEEIIQIKEHYPDYKWLFFYDDNFTVSKTRVRQLLEGMARHKLDYYWGCYCRVDLVDHDLLKLMKEHGCRMISYGIESGSRHVQSLINKNIDLKQAGEAIRMTRDLGIVVKCSMFFNYPGETVRDVLKTLQFVFQNKLSGVEIPWGYMTQVYPGTQLCLELIQRSYFPKDFNWSGKFDVPHIDNIPIYKNGHNAIKNNLAKLYKIGLGKCRLFQKEAKYDFADV